MFLHHISFWAKSKQSPSYWNIGHSAGQGAGIVLLLHILKVFIISLSVKFILLPQLLQGCFGGSIDELVEKLTEVAEEIKRVDEAVMLCKYP